MRKWKSSKNRILSGARLAVGCVLVIAAGVNCRPDRSLQTPEVSTSSGVPNPIGEGNLPAGLSSRGPSSQASPPYRGTADPPGDETFVDRYVDETIRRLEAGASEPLDKAEESRLAAFELDLRRQMASGWIPPGKGRLELPQTEEEIRRMPTRELGIGLWATGLHARELIAFLNPDMAMKRLEVCYKGHAELFQRPDLWQATR
jgi:hypothetical protein